MNPNNSSKDPMPEEMSLRAYAAIRLMIPNSGIDWLDDMIREAQRDGFAGIAPDMDVTDICNMMGWDADLPLGGRDRDSEFSQEEDTIWSRWRSLSMADRIAAGAKHRYHWADALVAARKAVKRGGGA